MKPIIAACLLLLIPFKQLKAQEKKIPLSISVFNNGSGLPGSGFLGMFSKTIHPGITLGTYHIHHAGQKHEVFQTLKLGYFYHRFSQHGIQLYSELGYRYLKGSGIYPEVLLGAGYLHSIPDLQRFEFKDGRYVKKHNVGRPQLMLTSGLGIGYDFEKKSSLPLRIFLQYQFWMQTPFVYKYVPLLPNTSLHLGIHYLFPGKEKKSS